MVAAAVGTIHRLNREMLEGEMFELLRCQPVLRHDELQLVAVHKLQRRPGLRADADPIETGRRFHRAVGLDGDGEPALVKRVDQRRVDLQERLAARADDEAPFAFLGPERRDCLGERGSAAVLAAAAAVRTDEIGVAELAGRRGAVFLAAGPEIAAREAAEHRRATALRSFTL
jgi:hypothetical protein